MKQILLFVAIAWGVLVVEAARPDILPAGVLLLPVVIVGMLWCRSASGLATGGLILVINEIIHPQPLPLVPVLLTFVLTISVSARERDDEFSDDRSFWNRVPEWIQVIGLTVFGLLLLAGPGMIFDQQPLAEAWLLVCRYAPITVPVSVILALVMQFADEFGLRQSMYA